MNFSYILAFALLTLLVILMIALVLGAVPLYLSGIFKQAPFVPTSHKMVDKLLSLADFKDNQTVIELGSGDGRFLRKAAKKAKITGIGYEWIWWLPIVSKFLARRDGTSKQLIFERADFSKKDLSKADWVVVYLMPGAMKKLAKKLKEELKPGSKILSHAFEIKDLRLIKELPKDKIGSRCLLYEI